MSGFGAAGAPVAPVIDGWKHIRTGKVKLLAVVSEKRSPFFPDVPTVGEQGFKGANLDIWFGMWTPNNTPSDVVTRLNREIAKALASPTLKARYADLGGENVALDTAEAAGTLQDQPELLAALDADLEPVFDFLTGDLSFISLTLVLPAVVRLLKPGGDLLMLVKPQFELQPGQIGKGGIVRDPVHFEFVEKRLRDCCAGLGLDVLAWLDSPIEGGDGNHEFFIQARKSMDAVNDDLPLPAAPARQAARRVPRSATRSLLDAMDEDGEAAHAGQPGPARSKRREKKNAAE